MPKKKFKSNAGLGKALMNSKGFKPHVSQIATNEDGFKVHTTEVVDNKPKLKSILEQNSLEEFMQLAEMSQKTFEAERAGQQVVDNGTVIPHIVGGTDLQRQAGVVNKFLTEANIRNPQYTPLKIPRRPAWTKQMSAQEIHQQENMAFLEWRRDIATIEENNVKLAFTPFEKNIEVWKQLWRVIEKSDMLLQIVDARNPYFFYSADLEKYIAEVGNGKEFVLCINKADYLSAELIEHWNTYFKEKGVQHIFFSAKMEQEKLDEAEESDSEEEYDDEEDEEEKEFEPMFDELKKKIDIENELKEEQGIDFRKDKEAEKEVPAFEFNTIQIFTRGQLMSLLQAKAETLSRNPDNRLNVGTVGYPNVGKSSLINVLCGAKRVGVAAMPGKTKHFQTLNLEDDGRNICLVDCPGLVFPSIANSKAEMYCCGVLPIQNIREYVQPVSLIASRIPKPVLEAHYKIQLPARDSAKYTTLTFLNVYASKRGWITGNANPNTAEAAKAVLKDYTTGAIVFCHVRPDFDPAMHPALVQSGFEFAALKAEAEEALPGGDAQVESTAGNASLQQPAASHGQIGEQIITSGTAQNLAGLSEEDIDKMFFEKNDIAIKKLKLNKGEKRALKFMLKRQGESTNGELDIAALLNGRDVGELKQMLGKEVKKQDDAGHHRAFVATGGGQKRKNMGKGVGNNSNKTWNYNDATQAQDAETAPVNKIELS